jgi:hypothetical protein
MIPAVADFAQRFSQQGQEQQAGLRPPTAEQERQHQQGGEQARDEAGRQRYTGFTDKALLTPEELRQKLK